MRRSSSLVSSSDARSGDGLMTICLFACACPLRVTQGKSTDAFSSERNCGSTPACGIPRESKLYRRQHRPAELLPRHRPALAGACPFLSRLGRSQSAPTGRRLCVRHRCGRAMTTSAPQRRGSSVSSPPRAIRRPLLLHPAGVHRPSPWPFLTKTASPALLTVLPPRPRRHARRKSRPPGQDLGDTARTASGNRMGSKSRRYSRRRVRALGATGFFKYPSSVLSIFVGAS